jgi:hypothetical protein
VIDDTKPFTASESNLILAVCVLLIVIIALNYFFERRNK